MRNLSNVKEDQNEDIQETTGKSGIAIGPKEFRKDGRATSDSSSEGPNPDIKR